MKFYVEEEFSGTDILAESFHVDQNNNVYFVANESVIASWASGHWIKVVRHDALTTEPHDD